MVCGGELDLFRLGQLHHGLLEVRQRPLHQTARLLEVVQQRIPQGLLAQHLLSTPKQQQDSRPPPGELISIPFQGHLRTCELTRRGQTIMKMMHSGDETDTKPIDQWNYVFFGSYF